MTPYYSEETVYSKTDLEIENEDGISIMYYLQKIYPGFHILESNPSCSFFLYYISIAIIDYVGTLLIRKSSEFFFRWME